MTEEPEDQIITGDGRVIPPASILPEAPPAQPTPKPTEPGTSVRLWKPFPQEFTEVEHDELCAQLGLTQMVCFEVEDEPREGIAGHSLVCTVVE